MDEGERAQIFFLALASISCFRYSTCVAIANLPDMGRILRDIEEPSKILSASSGAGHGKDTECDGRCSSAQSAAGDSDVP